MGIFSIIWIIGIHLTWWRKRPSKDTIVYIELDNVAKDEESQDPKTINWRHDIHGIFNDCITLFIFIVVCFIMQIIGWY